MLPSKPLLLLFNEMVLWSLATSATLAMPLTTTYELQVHSNVSDTWTGILSDFATIDARSNGTFLNTSSALPPSFNQKKLVRAVVLGTLFVISLIGNTLTLFQTWRLRKRRSTIHILILHLAVADLIVTFFGILGEAIWYCTVQWMAPDILCKMFKYVQVFGLYLSTYIVVVISIDRCCSIVTPMSRHQAPGRIRKMILSVWVISAVCSLPQAFIFSKKRGPFKEDFYQCVTHGFYTQKWQEVLYASLTTLCLFGIPLFSMIVSYGLIFITIVQQSQILQGADQECSSTSGYTSSIRADSTRNSLLQRAKAKSLKMTICIVAMFLACWTPYYIVYISDITKTKQNDGTWWIFFCGMTNSMVNPVVYGAFHICRKSRAEPPRYMREFSKKTRSSSTSSPSSGRMAPLTGPSMSIDEHSPHQTSDHNSTKKGVDRLTPNHCIYNIKKQNYA